MRAWQKSVRIWGLPAVAVNWIDYNTCVLLFFGRCWRYWSNSTRKFEGLLARRLHQRWQHTIVPVRSDKCVGFPCASRGAHASEESLLKFHTAGHAAAPAHAGWSDALTLTRTVCSISRRHGDSLKNGGHTLRVVSTLRVCNFELRWRKLSSSMRSSDASIAQLMKTFSVTETVVFSHIFAVLHTDTKEYMT